MRRLNTFLAAAALVALPAVAQAQGNPGTNQPAPTQQQPSQQNQLNQQRQPENLQGTQGQQRLSATDRLFVQQAGQMNLAEQKFGELAQNKATTDEVKNYAKELTKDHQQSMDQLKQIAQRENINLPTTLNKTQQNTYDRLNGLSGKEFDQAFLKTMAANHEMAIRQFNTEIQDGQNAELKQYAQTTLPTLKAHRQMAVRDLRAM